MSTGKNNHPSAIIDVTAPKMCEDNESRLSYKTSMHLYLTMKNMSIRFQIFHIKTDGGWPTLQRPLYTEWVYFSFNHSDLADNVYGQIITRDILTWFSSLGLWGLELNTSLFLHTNLTYWLSGAIAVTGNAFLGHPVKIIQLVTFTEIDRWWTLCIVRQCRTKVFFSFKA